MVGSSIRRKIWVMSTQEVKGHRQTMPSDNFGVLDTNIWNTTFIEHAIDSRSGLQ